MRSCLRGFLLIIYIAILWANLSSVALFARYLFGSTFQFGYLYSLGGYDVYVGEILLCVGFLLVVGLCLLLKKRILANLQFVLVAFFVVAVLIVFIVSMAKHDGGSEVFSPQFVPGKNPLLEILGVIQLSPWAFVGFESIAQSASDFKFQHKNTLKLFLVSIGVSTLIYIAMCLLSAAVFEGDNWYASLTAGLSGTGVRGLVPFFVADRVMGGFGVGLFVAALLCIIITSLAGNAFGLSGLLAGLAEDHILPQGFAKTDKNGYSVHTIVLLLASCVVILFFGRAAIGWIVDVTTLAGAIVYGYVGACTLRLGLKAKEKVPTILGILSVAFCIVFALLSIIPSLDFTGSNGLEKESFIIFAVWGILGFVYFRYVLKNDKKHAFGRSTVVWFALMILVLFASIIWVFRSIEEANEAMIAELEKAADPASIAQIVKQNEINVIIYTIVLAAVSTITQIVLFSVFRMMKNRAIDDQKELDLANEMATKDSMTGVRNKLAYSAKESLIDTSIEKKTIQEFAIVVCDVNDLKYVNDSFGHEYGDAFIKRACCMICETYRHSPVFRIGGDEFVVILEGQDYENREKLLSRILTISEENNKSQGVVISVGMAEYVPGTDNALARVFRRADQAMYDRKQYLKFQQTGKPDVKKFQIG